MLCKRDNATVVFRNNLKPYCERNDCVRRAISLDDNAANSLKSLAVYVLMACSKYFRNFDKSEIKFY